LEADSQNFFEAGIFLAVVETALEHEKATPEGG